MLEAGPGTMVVRDIRASQILVMTTDCTRFANESDVERDRKRPVRDDI